MNRPDTPGEPDQPAEIVITSDGWRKACPDIEDLCRTAVRSALSGGRPGDVAVLLGRDSDVRELNRAWRNRDMPTNVLAFPSGPAPAPQVPHPLGSIALAYEVVRSESEEQGRPFRAHVAHLVVHGTLHLLGYDHRDDREAGAPAFSLWEVTPGA